MANVEKIVEALVKPRGAQRRKTDARRAQSRQAYEAVQTWRDVRAAVARDGRIGGSRIA